MPQQSGMDDNGCTECPVTILIERCSPEGQNTPDSVPDDQSLYELPHQEALQDGGQFADQGIKNKELSQSQISINDKVKDINEVSEVEMDQISIESKIHNFYKTKKWNEFDTQSLPAIAMENNGWRSSHTWKNKEVSFPCTGSVGEIGNMTEKSMNFTNIHYKENKRPDLIKNKQGHGKEKSGEPKSTKKNTLSIPVSLILIALMMVGSMGILYASKFVLRSI